MSDKTIIRIYADETGVWAVKDFPGYSYAMLKELERFTPEELRKIADWIANTDYTRLEKPIHIEELV